MSARHPAEAVGAAGFVALALMTAGLAASALRHPPSRPGLALALAALLLPLPAALRVDNFADRYLHLPLAGLALALVPPLAVLRERPRLTASVLGLSVCVALNSVSLSRWRDTPSLFQHAAKRDPTPTSLHSLGVALAARDRYAEAAEAYARAAEGGRSPESRSQLAAMQLRQGQVSEALASLDRARSEGLEPDATWWLNRASCQRLLGRLDGAERSLDALEANLGEDERGRLQRLTLARLREDPRTAERLLARWPAEQRAAVDAAAQELVQQSRRAWATIP